MIKKAYITYTKNDLVKVDMDVFYLEEYMDYANVDKARVMTEQEFHKNSDFIDRYDYKGYKVSWSWYDLIYRHFYSYLEIVKLFEFLKKEDYQEIIIGNVGERYESVILKTLKLDFQIEAKKEKKVLKNLSIIVKGFIKNTILLIFTIISVSFFVLKRNKKVALWCGDFIYKNTRSDFRLNHLYQKIDENSIQYVEFIRTRSLKYFFINIFKRRRFSIYYFSFVYFFWLYISIKNFLSLIKVNSYQTVLESYKKDNETLLMSMPIMVFLLKNIRIRSILIFAFSSRSAHLHIAAKGLNIKTIGIMHGLSSKKYLVNEFMEGYHEQKNIGPDIFGVWSDQYKKYYRKFCKITPNNRIKYSGLLRPYNIEKSIFFEYDSSKKIKILLISEPLVEVKEILPYIKEICKCKEFEVGIKVRPMVRDIFYEKLKLEYPEIRNLKVYNGQIMEDGKKFDVFMGSHSTAVMEASLIGKVSILVGTKKWGDYFETSEIVIDGLVCTESNNIVNYIKTRVKNEGKLNTIIKIRENYFGDNRDGAQWMINELN